MRKPRPQLQHTTVRSDAPVAEVIAFLTPSGVRIVSPALNERQHTANRELLRRIASHVAALDSALKQVAGEVAR